jgi:hypothetical protein
VSRRLPNSSGSNKLGHQANESVAALAAGLGAYALLPKQMTKYRNILRLIMAMQI